ncbi:uncharacterized protein LOC119448775 [Dermacentor silvarum]|uniref:uncharacterized protein LOC119448775 n=1 Tax=Dermacentor silvarum TaxID=543639 RepID=UPI002101B759|nr:uncharacterized protein LOC119448775 [Dermacentor silvarum]
MRSPGDSSPAARGGPLKTSDGSSPKRKRSHKKRKGVLKRSRSSLKGSGNVMTMQELMKEIKERKSSQEGDLTKRRKADKSKRKSTEKKHKKKKEVEKKTADTQTSFLVSEPETPVAMLESGDRGFCDFRFTVGLDRVVRGAMARNESLGQDARGESLPPPKASAADVSKGDVSARLAPPLDAPGPSAAPALDSPKVVATTESKKTPNKPPQKKQDKRSRKRKGRKSETKRKGKRAPKNASSVPFLFRWRPTGTPSAVVHLTSSTAKARNELPSSQAEQLSSRVFSWTSKATRATSVDDESKLLGSGTETQITVASTKTDVSPLRKASLPTGLAKSNVDILGKEGGDEPRVEGKKEIERALLKQKARPPAAPLDSTTFTVSSVSPESPVKETGSPTDDSAVAHMTVCFADFLTTTKPETRSLEEPTPIESSTEAETTNLFAESVPTTAAEPNLDETVSPPSTGYENGKNEENSSGSPPDSRSEVGREKAGVTRKHDGKSRNRSGRDKDNEKSGKYSSRKEQRSKGRQLGNIQSEQNGRGNPSPEPKDPGKNAIKMGSPEARSTNLLVPDASAPGNRNPGNKSLEIGSDVNESRARGSWTRKGRRNKTQSSRNQASKIQGTKDVRDYGRKSGSPEIKTPEYKTPGNKSNGRQGSGSPSTTNDTRETSESEQTKTLKSASSRYVSGTGRCDTDVATSQPSKTGSSEPTSNGGTVAEPSSASRTDKSKGTSSELKSEATMSASTSRESKMSATKSDSRATSSSRRRPSSRKRRQRRLKTKRRQGGDTHRRGERREQAASPPRQGGAGGGRDRPEVKVRSIDQIARTYLERPQGYLCCFLFAGASLTFLMLLGFMVLYYALSHSPPPPQPLQHGETETMTYTLSTRQTGYTSLDPEVTRIIHYCDTAFCSQEARYLESVVRSGQGPCVNFYEHVCDKWLSQQNNRLSGAESPPSRDTVLQSSLARQLLSLVQDSTEPDLRTAAKLYSSCAVGRRDNLTSEDKVALKTMFQRWEIRSWPRTDRENLSNISVWRFAAELSRDLDLATLFLVTVGVDPNDVGATILELDSLRLLFSDNDREFEHAAEIYRTAIREAMTSLINTTSTVNLDDFTDRLVNVSGVLRSATFQSAAEGDFAVIHIRELGQGVRHFIETLLANVPGGAIGSLTKVTAKSPKYVTTDLQNALLSIPPLDALNYMGLLVLVRLAPFLPERLQALRTLFANIVIGHAVADVADTARLCLWLVDHSLPACFSKVSQKWLQQQGHQQALRQWLSHLESVFLANVADFAWMTNFSAILVRYRFKRRPVTQFGGGSFQDACAPEIPLNATADHPLRFYLNVSMHRPDRRLRGLLTNSTVLRRRGGVDAGSELRTEVTFDHALHRLHVPAALFNLSVPTNSSFFVFQLARVAVRFYRGLVQALYENPFEREVPLRFTDESRRRLSDLASCFVADAQRSPSDFRGLWSPPPAQRSWSSVGKPLLDQTSALLLTLRALDEFLHVRRIWKADDRLAEMPAETAQKLFFVYLALDNCEPIQTAEGGGVPAKLRLNLPLRHVRQFSEAFNCSPPDHMALAPGMSCNVLRSGSSVQLAPFALRRQRGTRPTARFGPLDGPNDGRPAG